MKVIMTIIIASTIASIVDFCSCMLFDRSSVYHLAANLIKTRQLLNNEQLRAKYF